MQEAMLGLVKPPRKPVNLAMNSGSSRHAWESWKDIDEFYDEFWCRKSLTMLPTAIWMNRCHNLHDGWCGGHWSRAHHSRGAGQPTHRPGGSSISQSFDREAMNVRSINSIRGCSGFTPSACHWPTMHHVLTRAGHSHGSFFPWTWESVSLEATYPSTFLLTLLFDILLPVACWIVWKLTLGSGASGCDRWNCWMLEHVGTCWNPRPPHWTHWIPFSHHFVRSGPPGVWGDDPFRRDAEEDSGAQSEGVEWGGEKIWICLDDSICITSQYLKGQGLIQKLDTWYIYIYTHKSNSQCSPGLN